MLPARALQLATWHRCLLAISLLRSPLGLIRTGRRPYWRWTIKVTLINRLMRHYDQLHGESRDKADFCLRARLRSRDPSACSHQLPGLLFRGDFSLPSHPRGAIDRDQSANDETALSVTHLLFAARLVPYSLEMLPLQSKGKYHSQWHCLCRARRPMAFASLPSLFFSSVGSFCLCIVYLFRPLSSPFLSLLPIYHFSLC